MTEEEYQLCIRILQHLLPNQDLSLDSLRRIASELDRGTSNVYDQNSNIETSGVDPNDYGGNEESQSEEISDLNKHLGCMLVDSLGEYRELPS